MSRAVHDGTPAAGALTTVFTPTPPSCSTETGRFYTSSCMPPNWAAYLSGTVGYYSPAICPISYTSAGTPRGGFGPRIEADETAIVCCPPSYNYGPTAASFCYGTTYTTYISTVRGTTTTVSGVVSTQTISTTYPITTLSYAYAIQVRWAASDLPNLQTHPLTYGQSITAKNTTTPTPSSPGAGSNPPSHGLSTGAKAGIGVGIAIFVLALVAGALLILRRSRRRRQQPPDQEHPAPLPPTASAPPPGVAHKRESAHSSVVPESDSGLAKTPNTMSTITEGWNRASYQPPQDHAIAHEELLRVQERRNRLVEIERLEQEENRIRSQLATTPNRPELY